MPSNEWLIETIKKIQEMLEAIRIETEPIVKAKLQKKYHLDPGELEVLIEYCYQHLGRKISLFDPQRCNSAISWLLTVTDHAAVDYFRTTHIETQPLPGGIDFIDQRPPPAEQFSREKAQAILRSAIARLEPKQREIILLTATGYGYEEIIKIMGFPSIEAARMFKSRTLKELHRTIQKLGYGPEVLRSLFQ